MESTYAVKTHIDKVMITEEQMDSIKHFIGFDNMFKGQAERRRRPTSGTDFEVMLEDKDGRVTYHTGFISANNVPVKGSLRPDEPVAIGTIVIDDQEWHMLFVQKTSSPHETDLLVESRLVSYDGEPEDLLHLTKLFEDDA